MGTAGWPPWAATTLAFALSLLVAVLDDLTGVEISFSLFYAGPVALAAWYGPGLCGRGHPQGGPSDV